jgi:hypothetical protein
MKRFSFLQRSGLVNKRSKQLIQQKSTRKQNKAINAMLFMTVEAIKRTGWEINFDFPSRFDDATQNLHDKRRQFVL